MKSFNVTLASTQRLLYKGDASEIIAPAQEGTMSILSRHAPLLATLRKGTIKIINNSSEDSFDIKSGFMEVSKKAQQDGKQASFVNIFVREP